MIFGLTSLGVLHTAISLVAVADGVVSLFRYREISLIGAALQARRLHAGPQQ